MFRLVNQCKLFKNAPPCGKFKWKRYVPTWMTSFTNVPLLVRPVFVNYDESCTSNSNTFISRLHVHGNEQRQHVWHRDWRYLSKRLNSEENTNNSKFCISFFSNFDVILFLYISIRLKSYIYIFATFVILYHNYDRFSLMFDLVVT